MWTTKRSTQLLLHERAFLVAKVVDSESLVICIHCACQSTCIGAETADSKYRWLSFQTVSLQTPLYYDMLQNTDSSLSLRETMIQTTPTSIRRMPPLRAHSARTFCVLIKEFRLYVSSFAFVLIAHIVQDFHNTNYTYQSSNLLSSFLFCVR